MDHPKQDSPKGARPKRKVLGVATTPDVIGVLDHMVSAASYLNDQFPGISNLPNTRSGIAAWMLERYAGFEMTMLLRLQMKVHKILEHDEEEESEADQQSFKRIDELIKTHPMYGRLYETLTNSAKDRKNEITALSKLTRGGTME